MAKMISRSLFWEEQLYETKLIIGGQDLAPVPAGSFERRGPSSDKIVTRAAAARASDARDAAAAAARAFDLWSKTSHQDRVAVLECAASLMAASTDEIVAIATDEVGSSPDWVKFNVEIAVAMLRQTRDLAGALQTTTSADGKYRIHRRPAGVVVGIAPWNAAVTLATRAVAAPLACGNTVVLKGSELCPKTHEWVVKMINSAGLPDGVLNYVTNAPDHAAEVVEALVAYPAVRRVNFTGSTRVGREIAVTAARHLKPCILELSGKGTMIVLADADLAHAAKSAAHGSFFNQGQICMSTERIIVDETVADDFAALLRIETENLRYNQGDFALGSLISSNAAIRVRSMIDDALSRGARLVTGGELTGGGIHPAVVDDVAPGMRLYDEEAFGPVVGLIRVRGPEEALAVANDTDFGLVASIFTKNTRLASDMLADLEIGIGHINGSTVFDDPSMPFGGVKASGYGRFGGTEALNEFTECQWIAIHDAVVSEDTDGNDVL